MFTVRFQDTNTEEEVSVNVDWRPFKLPKSLQSARQALTSAEQMTAETDKLRWPCRMHGYTKPCVYYKLAAQGGAAATSLWATTQAHGMSNAVTDAFNILCDEAKKRAADLRREIASLQKQLEIMEEPSRRAQSRGEQERRQRRLEAAQPRLQAEAREYRAWLTSLFGSIDEGGVTAHLREGPVDEVLARPFKHPITRGKLRCLRPPERGRPPRDAWLNDTVINALLAVIGHSVPSVAACTC
jgi:hypothetical protein